MALLCEVLTLSDCIQAYSGGLKSTGVCKILAENVTLTSRTERRIVIKHCVPVGMTPMDTHMFVYMAKLKPNCSVVLVFQLHTILSDGCG